LAAVVALRAVRSAISRRSQPPLDACVERTCRPETATTPGLPVTLRKALRQDVAAVAEDACVEFRMADALRRPVRDAFVVTRHAEAVGEPAVVRRRIRERRAEAEREGRHGDQGLAICAFHLPLL